MKYALVNPHWTFEGSTYFGCPEPHFPLELLSAREMLRAAGHEVLLIDAFMEDLTPAQVRRAAGQLSTKISSSSPPRRPIFSGAARSRSSASRAVDRRARPRTHKVVVIGPHGSVTPRATLEKTGADIVLRGEPDQTLAAARHPALGDDCRLLLARRATAPIRTTPGLGATDMRAVGHARLLRLSRRAPHPPAPHLSRQRRRPPQARR